MQIKMVAFVSLNFWYKYEDQGPVAQSQVSVTPELKLNPLF